MIPYLLAIAGGYLIGQSRKGEYNPLSNPYNILKEGGEVITWRIMYYRAIPTRGGDKMMVMEDQDIITGSLNSVSETAKNEVIAQGYEYAQIVDQKGKALGKKVTKFEEGGDIKKQEWVAVYRNSKKPHENKVIQAFGNNRDEAIRSARMSEGHYGIKKPFELFHIYSHSGNLPMTEEKNEVKEIKIGDKVRFRGAKYTGTVVNIFEKGEFKRPYATIRWDDENAKKREVNTFIGNLEKIEEKLGQ